MLGTSEYVAEACEEQLNNLNHKVTLHLKPNFSSILEATLSEDHCQNSTWLVCTSTHGAGDFPDNIQSFVEDLKNCEQDLSSINFIIIAIGDSNYDTFCKAGKELNKLLIKSVKSSLRTLLRRSQLLCPLRLKIRKKINYLIII